LGVRPISSGKNHVWELGPYPLEKNHVWGLAPLPAYSGKKGLAKEVVRNRGSTFNQTTDMRSADTMKRGGLSN